MAPSQHLRVPVPPDSDPKFLDPVCRSPAWFAPAAGSPLSDEHRLALVVSGLGPMTASRSLRCSSQLCDLRQSRASRLLLAIEASSRPVTDWVELLQQCAMFQCSERGVPLVDTPPEFQSCPAFAAPPDSVALRVASAPSDWSDAPASATAEQLESFASASLSALSFDYDFALTSLELVSAAAATGAGVRSSPRSAEQSSVDPSIVTVARGKRLGV